MPSLSIRRRRRVWMKIQDPRRALWTIIHSTGMLKGGENMVSSTSSSVRGGFRDSGHFHVVGVHGELPYAPWPVET
jgi:hypothetical protein